MKEKKIKPENSAEKINLFWVIVLALIFGVAGGISTLLISRQFIPQPSSNISATPAPVDNSQDNLRQANSIIENAKKIIAGQENKINDTISSSQNSLVGVFKKNQSVSTTSPVAFGKNFNILNYYKLSDAVSEGLVVTSDGWILTSDFTKSAAQDLPLKNFVVITKNKDVYNIDKLSQTGIGSYVFVHLVNAKNLPVKSFVSKMDLTNSQSLLALNWLGESYLTSIVDKTLAVIPVKDSDASSQDIVFANDLGNYFDNAFIFSLDSQVVGYFDKKNGPVPIYNFQPLIDGLLQGKESKHASLGVTYVNLQEFAMKDTSLSQGALIYSNTKNPAVKVDSAAALAGLQAGDIILSVDNVNIDSTHDLGDVLEKYSAGDKISIIYQRNGVENSINVTLQTLK
jgi:hypothetical protein